MDSGSDRRRYSWEENTERRIGIAEQKLDKLLDPERGIYARLARIEGNLMRWAIAILASIIVSLVVQLLTGR
jgi:hypothetical protein